MSTLNIDIDQAVAVLTAVAVLALIVERAAEVLCDVTSRSTLAKGIFPAITHGMEAATVIETRRTRKMRFLIVAAVLGMLTALGLQVRVFEALGFSGHLGLDAASGGPSTPENNPFGIFDAWPTIFDTFVTGLLIGGGSDPVHQMIRKIQVWRRPEAEAE